MYKRQIYSVLFALIAIFLYILIRFRNVAFSVGSTVALSLIHIEMCIRDRAYAKAGAKIAFNCRSQHHMDQALADYKAKEMCIRDSLYSPVLCKDDAKIQ